MKVVINGEPREITEGITLEQLLELLEMDPQTTVAEHNGEIVERKHYPETALSPGDEIELVRFVGGG